MLCVGAFVWRSAPRDAERPTAFPRRAWERDPPNIEKIPEKGLKPGENVYAAYGQTVSGRYLSAFFVLKEGGIALILSARDMDKKERKRYGKRK